MQILHVSVNVAYIPRLRSYFMRSALFLWFCQFLWIETRLPHWADMVGFFCFYESLGYYKPPGGHRFLYIVHWHADQTMKSHVLKAVLYIINLIIEDCWPSIMCSLLFKQNQLSCFSKAKMYFEINDGLKKHLHWLQTLGSLKGRRINLKSPQLDKIVTGIPQQPGYKAFNLKEAMLES